MTGVSRDSTIRVDVSPADEAYERTGRSEQLALAVTHGQTLLERAEPLADDRVVPVARAHTEPKR